MFINVQNAGRLSSMLRHHKTATPLVKIIHFTDGLSWVKQVLQIMNVENVD